MPLSCTYCGNDVTPTTGKLVIRQSGDRLFFCSGKCEKNFDNNRSLEYAEKHE